MSGLRVLLCTMTVLSAGPALAEDIKVAAPAPVTEAAVRPAGDTALIATIPAPVVKLTLPDAAPPEPARTSADPGLDENEGAGFEKWMLEYGRTLGRSE
jgi:hypothetical protein